MPAQPGGVHSRQLEKHPVGVPLLIIVLGMLLLSYRAYEQLHDRHEQLERHHGFARSLAREQDTDAIIEEVLDRTRQLLHAEAAELHLTGCAYRSASKGSGSPSSVTTSAPSITTQHWPERVRDGGAILLAAGTKDPQEQALLAEAGIPEAAAAPVRIRNESHGVLVVIERMGEVASFTAGDLRALETFSHQASIALDNSRLVDKLRQEAADRAHDAIHNLPDELLVAPLGGDASAVLVRRDTTPNVVADSVADSVATTVQRVRKALSEDVYVRDVGLHLEASIGSAISPQDGQGAEGLLQRADVAMYRAKEQRSGYEPYTAALDRSSAERLALYTELRRAVLEGSLQVVFQPCVEPRSGHVLSAEALARWHHPTLGDIGPDESIPLAEGSGLTGPLPSSCGNGPCRS